MGRLRAYESVSQPLGQLKMQCMKGAYPLKPQFQITWVEGNLRMPKDMGGAQNLKAS